jgi:signal transduction histidine kinase
MPAREGKARRPSAAALVAWTSVAAVAVIVADLAVPFAGLPYRAPALHVLLDATEALIALLVAYLMYGRFRQRRRLQELLLVLALGALAFANLLVAALPSAVALGNDVEYSGWAGLAIRFVGSVLLTAAALTTTDRRVERRAARMIAVGVGAVVVVVGLAGSAWGPYLPPIVDPAVELGDATRPLIVAHPVVLVLQAVGAVLYATAAVAFSRRSDRRHDELFRWVAIGCVLAAAARVHYMFFPSLYSDYVDTGDLLRLGFYLLLLVGAGLEIRSYWRLRMHSAVLEDRRRMARELHDGLTQELTYISSQSERLAAEPGDVVAAERIRAAAIRALDEVRSAIAAIARPVDLPLPQALRQMVDELARRYDAKIVTFVDPDAQLDSLRSESLLRIAAEAVRNAVRHGQAQRIEVRLTSGPLCLAIVDDGQGFEPDRADGLRPGGFGITSMRERAQGLGGVLTIDSAPAGGTVVKVLWR